MNRTLNDLREQAKSRIAPRKDGSPLPGSGKHSSLELETNMAQGAREPRTADVMSLRSSGRAGGLERRTVRARRRGI